MVVLSLGLLLNKRKTCTIASIVCLCPRSLTQLIVLRYRVSLCNEFATVKGVKVFLTWKVIPALEETHSKLNLVRALDYNASERNKYITLAGNLKHKHLLLFITK